MNVLGRWGLVVGLTFSMIPCDSDDLTRPSGVT